MSESNSTSPPSFENLPEDLLAGRAIALPVLRDLYRISKLSAKQCMDVSDALAAMDVSDDVNDVPEVVQHALDETDNELVTSVLRVIVDVPPDEVIQIVAKLTDWVGAHETRQEIFTEDRY